jgi:LysR family transcriptional regulator for metE and metH
MQRIAPPRPRLDVRDLQLVLALAAAGSTARAASSLHLTQSAVSRGLLLAEEKLGTRLFERTPRGLTPTPAGKRLITGSGAVLSQLVELEQGAASMTGVPVRLRMVCECYTAYRWLPSTLASLRRTVPGLEVTLAIEHTSDPVQALLAGAIDVAFLTTSAIRGPLEEAPLLADELVFVMAAAHPLAGRSTLAPRDLLDVPLLTLSQTPPAATKWFVDRVFGRARPRLQGMRFPLTEAVVDAARAGLGVAVLSEWIAGPYLGGGDLVVRRLKGRVLERPWRIAYRPAAAGGALRLAAALTGAPPRLHGVPA